jgi:hypothetical protein
VRAELFHAGRRTDMTKVIIDYRNFSNAPKIPLWTLTFCCIVTELGPAEYKRKCSKPPPSTQTQEQWLRDSLEDSRCCKKHLKSILYYCSKSWTSTNSVA